MSNYGTLEEVFGKLYDLYMANEISDFSVGHYLLGLRHSDGRNILGPKDVIELVARLQK